MLYPSFPWTNLHALNIDHWIADVEQAKKDIIALREEIELAKIDEKIKENVIKKIDDLVADGTIEKIINEEILTDIKDEISKLSENLDNLETTENSHYIDLTERVIRSQGCKVTLPFGLCKYDNGVIFDAEPGWYLASNNHRFPAGTTEEQVITYCKNNGLVSETTGEPVEYTHYMPIREHNEYFEFTTPHSLGTYQRVYYDPVNKRLMTQVILWTRKVVPANHPIIAWQWGGKIMETGEQLTGTKMAMRFQVFENPGTHPQHDWVTDPDGSTWVNVQRGQGQVVEQTGTLHRLRHYLYAPWPIAANRYVVINIDFDARGWGGDYDDLTPSQVVNQRNAVINYWKQKEGTMTYSTGTGRDSENTTHTDCSGMVYLGYRYAPGGPMYGVSNLEDGQAVTGALVAYVYPGQKLPIDIMRPGDVLCYKVRGKKVISHVAIYAGDNTLWDQRGAGAAHPGRTPYGPDAPADWLTGPHPFTTDAENEWYTKQPNEIWGDSPSQGTTEYAKIVRWIM